MGVFSSTRFDNLQDVFRDQLHDLYDAEKRLTEALPKMADAARSPELKQAFRNHFEQTKQHVARLENVFDIMGEKPNAKTCEAMKGMISEGEEIIDAKGDDAVKDAAIIAAAQRVEHYEMAGYGAARTFAQHLGMTEASRLLQQTLDEEGATDKKLTDLAETSVNPRAERR